MANTRGICNAGKTYLINPNHLFGNDGFDNFFVPVEDLNIYVELTTSRKNRSILTVRESGLEGISTEKGKSRVSFIDGAKYGENPDGTDKKELTTSYTELTTVFNKTADTEKFGISSIDIDFNSAQYPLVNIKFIDVRGASLFNAGNPPNSEYAGFFDLPYPIFELKVKGYYGKTVKYCLHLTKWNAAFNSDTGNFEIEADFIGYTYAMLTDMLLGYLRAIVETPRGAQKFAEVKATMQNPAELITVNELLDKIVDVNEAIVKLQDSDETIQSLSLNQEVTAAVDGIQNQLDSGISSIRDTNNSALVGYAALDSGDGLIGVRVSKENEQEIKDNEADIKNWQDAMSVQIEKLNSLLDTGNQVILSDFTDVKTKSDFKYNDIMTGTTADNTLQLNFRNEWGLTADTDFDNFKTKRLMSLKEEDKSATLFLYDFKKPKDKLIELRNSLKSDEEKIKKQVGQKLSKTFVDLIGFEPTIRNIFRIFTVHAEVFMECLKDVSMEAEKDEQKLRKAELEKVNDKFDIASSGTPDKLPETIWPWPLYRKPSKTESKNSTLEEAYLGEDVEIPQNVPELVFVEELLEGLLKVARDDIDRQERIDNPDVIVDSWFPVNVTDTPLFGVTENPYKKASIGNSNNPIDPLKLMMLRAFTFLTVSNRHVTTIQAETMGTLEANTCYEGVQNETVRLAMLGDSSRGDGAIADEIIQTFLDGSGSTRNVTLNKKNKEGNKFMFGSGDKYYYNFIQSPEIVTGSFANVQIKERSKYIPVSGDYDGAEFFKEDGTFKSFNDMYKTSVNYSSNNDSFPTGNVYLSTSHSNSTLFNDGATHIRIFTENEYNNDAKALRPNYIQQVDKIQKMVEQLKAEAAENAPTGYLDSTGLYDNDRNQDGTEVFGWNILGDETAKYAFTTVQIVDITNGENIGEGGEGDNSFPSTPISAAPLKSLFYVSNKFKTGMTCLSKKRTTKAPLEDLKKIKQKFKNGTTAETEYYDLGKFGIGVRPFSKSTTIDTNPDLGKNRELFNENDVYIPFVDFVVYQRDANAPGFLGIGSGSFDNYAQSWSLFGSRWYFEQRRSSSPKAARALLFLHTLPWNQLYTDNSVSDGYDAAMFDNNEGNTLSNLFGRKSAFLNVPYLWAAFIGGILWRYSSADIIYEKDTSSKPDPSGLIPSYAGGSGKFDPIVWGKRVNENNSSSDYTESFVSEYNIHKYGNECGTNSDTACNGRIPNGKFPYTFQYLTSWTADGPLYLDTDGDYKFIESELRNLPVQAKREFRRIFFDFVKSTEWQQIRDAFEVQDYNQNSTNPTQSWDYPNSLTNVKWDVDGSNNGNWDTGSYKWNNRWNDITNWDWSSGPYPNPNDNLIFDPAHKVTSTVPTYGREGNVNGTTTQTNDIPAIVTGIKKTAVDDFRNWKNWEYINPVYQRAAQYRPQGNITTKYLVYNYDIALRDVSANKTLVELFKRGAWIANASYKPWVHYTYTTSGGDQKDGAKEQDKIRNDFAVSKTGLKLYVQSFVTELKRLNQMDTKTDEENALKQQLFNTMDNNAIRLNIYRHCKSLYDKWIAGSEGNILYACGTKNKDLDKASASKDRDGNPRLIDSFRFINRAFNDIGDEYLINPTVINEIVVGNMNQSFYDLISRVLSDNNFTFIALPSYIDFTSTDEMLSLFKPEIYSEALAENVAGPTFVCTYVGQSSNKLDLGLDASFPNDGFDVVCDGDGNLRMGEGPDGINGLPDDFTKDKADNEHNVIVFSVDYGQQNQSIFTDVRLDQKEFAETDESLQITDSIAKNASQSDRTQAGQNLWNVYQVRAYSTEITALGNAMIQPMMYFQLNNIPMFHGAYMIFHAKHKITPNHMKTTFKGSRTRYVETPLVDSETLYMSMLGTLSDVDGSTYSLNDKKYDENYSTGRRGSGKVNAAPIVKTIIENGGSNGSITDGTGNIKLKAIPKIDGIWNLKLNDAKENVMLAEAVDPLVEMLKDWVTWMKANGFNGNSNGYAYITSVFRDYDKQVAIKKEYGGAAAKPGTSPHGWGIAVDLQFLRKDGSVIPNDRNTAWAFDVEKNPAIKWLYDNSYNYGFVLPYGLRDKAGLEEHWHFEYHGTAAKCLISEHPSVYSYEIKVSGNQKASVKNPTVKTGEGPATYTGCKYESIKTGDGSETGCPKVEKEFRVHSGFKSSIEKILNGTHKCKTGWDCAGSIAGLKKVPALWSNNKLTKRGVIAMAFGVTEGFGAGVTCKNPGNIRGNDCGKDNGFKKFNTWEDGWNAWNTDYLTAWTNGKVPATKSANYPDCYKSETNEIFKESGIEYKELDTYNYVPKSKPTLRQFLNVYAPWGDNNNPSNYIAGVAKTLKDYGYTINVDEPMASWL